MTTSPSPNTANSMQRIARISRAMVWACRVLIVGLPLALVWYWSCTAAVELAVQGNLPASAVQAPLHTWQRVAAGAVAAIPLVLLLTGVWQAQQCFSEFARGQVFTVQATTYLRRFAGWVAAAALAAMVASTVISVLLTLQNLAGARHLVVGLSTNHVFTMFFAALVWLMADVIGRGQELADENARFV